MSEHERGPLLSGLTARIDSDPEGVARDLGRLVLTIAELLRQLMERQAIRRVEAGDLPDETVERLGLGLMRLEQAMGDLREHFGLGPEHRPRAAGRSTAAAGSLR